ncbi:MAG: amidohydrolase family protein [Firmicutes bacterium]|nr:amidohydrolase family protein [Bacillota bacterium]
MSVYALKGRVIDGVAGEAVEQGTVLVRDGKIESVGPREQISIPPEAEVIEVNDGTILPGFIDCHTHFTGGFGGNIYTTSHHELILQAAHGVGILLDAGFTGARDMSMFGPYLAKSIDKGFTRGPRIMPGGRLLSVTAGHGDMDTNFSVEHCQRQNPITLLVDGVDECLKGTRSQFRIGAKFIKISATGGVSSLADGLDDVQFSFEEVKAIVEEARRHGTYVAAHCTGTAGTIQALEAGVTSIEHGVFLDERCIELMVKNDATLVTTLSVSLGIPNMKNFLPPHVYEKGVQCAEANLRSIEMARKAGIRIALGTDFSNSKNSPYAENGKEFVSMVKAGLTPMEAIWAGTRNAAHLMKLESEIGTLEAGKLADIVIVEGNPLADISVLAHKDSVKVVLKDGVVEKNALA